jgi:hypothetical protein
MPKHCFHRTRIALASTASAAAVFCAATPNAHAQGVFDPSAVVLQRIRANPLAMQKLGYKPEASDLQFVERQRTQNMVFDFAASRGAIPGTVVLQDATASNCVAEGMRQVVEVARSTELQ